MDKGSLSYKILAILTTTGELPKKTLHASLPGYSSQYYSRTFKNLEENEYIKTRKRNKRIQVSITTRGVELLKQTDSEREVAVVANRTDYMRRRRNDMFATAKPIMIACGIVVSGKLKPDIKSLRNNESEDYEKNKNLFNKSVKRGLFLSSQDLRILCSKPGNPSEYLSATRLLGIILFEKNIFYIYNVGEKLIQLFPKKEIKSIQAIEKTLLSFDELSTDGVRVAKEAGTREAIVFAQTKAMLPKIYRGDKYGKAKRGVADFQKKRQERWRGTHATYGVFSINFSNIYFCSCDANGTKLLSNLKGRVINQKDSNEEILKSMNLKKDSIDGYLTYDVETSQNVIPLTELDITSIDSYVKTCKSYGIKVTIVAPKYYADPISRCFGSILDNFIDSNTMEEIEIYKYDDDGYPVGENRINGLLKVNNERRVAKAGDDADEK